LKLSALFITALFLFHNTQGQIISPPTQPLNGPGGKDYLYQSVKQSKFGANDTTFWIFEPENPSPDSADLIIFNHGWGVTNPA
jgi:hypothetical protein